MLYIIAALSVIVIVLLVRIELFRKEERQRTMERTMKELDDAFAHIRNNLDETGCEEFERLFANIMHLRREIDEMSGELDHRDRNEFEREVDDLMNHCTGEKSAEDEASH